MSELTNMGTSTSKAEQPPREEIKEQKDSRLMQLPGEVRNMIYRQHLLNSNMYGADIDTIWAREPFFANTCHKIQEESISLWLAENCFTVALRKHDQSPIIRDTTLKRLHESGRKGVLMHNLRIEYVEEDGRWRKLVHEVGELVSRGGALKMVVRGAALTSDIKAAEKEVQKLIAAGRKGFMIEDVIKIGGLLVRWKVQ